MKVPAFIVALLIILLGVAGLVAPLRLLAIASYFVTPAGLYIAAALRLAIGIILLNAASGSRFPRALWVLGVLALIGGVATLLLGVDTARAIVNWVTAQGTTVIRVFGVFALAIGGFIGYSVSNRHSE